MMNYTEMAERRNAGTEIPVGGRRSLRGTEVSPGDGGGNRWSQVLARDRAADGTFVYAVTSTGVFCRPSCPSRRPRRDRVRFFDTTTEAAAAGFRACKRCRPTEPTLEGAPGAVRRAARYIAAHADETIPLARLAEVAGLSASHFQRQFTRHIGLSPREYQAACRADRFRRELRAGRDVTSAIYEAGYGSPSRVYEASPTGSGLSPASYRKGGEGQRIGFAIVPCALGTLLVAATDKGVCAVKLGDSARALEDDLRREFPKATIGGAGDVPRAWLRSIVSLAAARASDVGVPLDIRGTAFQWQVWRALQQIPVGETRTYAELARDIGRPSAVRAVARACATNPVCLVVPCHRVVPRQGGQGGYRWGSVRKARLLGAERRRK